MEVTQIEWIVTLGVTLAVLLFDVIFIARRPHVLHAGRHGSSLGGG